MPERDGRTDGTLLCQYRAIKMKLLKLIRLFNVEVSSVPSYCMSLCCVSPFSGCSNFQNIRVFKYKYCSTHVPKPLGRHGSPGVERLVDGTTSMAESAERSVDVRCPDEALCTY